MLSLIIVFGIGKEVDFRSEFPLTKNNIFLFDTNLSLQTAISKLISDN